MQDLCGEYGVCATTTKGAFRLSSCSCFGGYRGWTCDDDALVVKVKICSHVSLLVAAVVPYLMACCVVI